MSENENIQKLADLLEPIRKNMETCSDLSEAQVRMQIIDPIIEKLEWDTRKMSNPEVIPEFPITDGKVDYAFLIEGKPCVIIEAKAMGRSIGGSEYDQLIRYIWETEAPLAVLTNGKEWHIYLTLGKKLVRNINLTVLESRDAATILWHYLSRERVASGDAEEKARKKIREDATIDKARNAIPAAWHNLIKDSDSVVVDALIEKTAAECASSPKKEDVLKFLQGLSARPKQNLVTDKKPLAAKPRSGGASRSSGSREVAYQLFNETKYARNAADAYFDIIDTLAAKDYSFSERLAGEINGRGTHLGREKKDMPTLEGGKKNSRQISSGWWLNMTLNNPQKKKYLKSACKVAGINFGKELKIKLLNA